MTKYTENPRRQWAAYIKDYDHPALRPGEKSRRCERCGWEYIPNARNQKYCDECRKEKEKR